MAAKIDLTKYGITGTTEIVYNPSYEMLFEEETKPELEGYEKGQVSELGAVNVMTGIYTGRSPKDKFIVVDENSKDTVWWTSDEYKNDNHPASQEAWKAVKEIAQKELSNKKLYVVDVGLGILVQVDNLSVASAFKVEYAIVIPAVLIITDQQTLRICRQSGLTCTGQTEEDCGVLTVHICICGAVHGSDAL